MERTTDVACVPLRLRRWALAALCALVLAGCAGGSGSSGFDIVAAENAAIDTALDTGSCVVERGLTICASTSETAAPSSTPTATLPPASPTRTAMSQLTATVTVAVTGTPTTTPPVTVPTATATQHEGPSATRTGTPGPSHTPTPTGTPARPSIDIQADPSDVAQCVSEADSQVCALRFVFLPTDIPAGVAYRAAWRQRNPDSNWRVVPVVGNAFEVLVPPNVATLQTAVLVYESDPGPVPNEVAVLSDTGADAAFVSAVLTVRSSASP